MATAVVATLLGAAPVQEFRRDHSALPTPDFGKARPFEAEKPKHTDLTRQAAAKTRTRAAKKVNWPDAGSVSMVIPAKSAAKARVGDLPVILAQPVSPAAIQGKKARKTAKAPDAAPAKASVRVVDRAKTEQLGIEGVVLSIERADGETDAASMSLTLDYSTFADAYTGNWASRLRMVQLPACAVTTPEDDKCRKTAPIPSVNDTEDGQVTAQVTTSRAAADRSGSLVLALSAGPSSDQGGYAATQLSPSATWAAGGSNGDFTWSYPMAAVPPPAGPSPSLTIGYSAQSIDGRTSSTAAQPGWIGEGFDLPTSYIERSYGSCEDDGQDKKYDQCWREQNASLVLNGKSSALIKDETTKAWRLQSDDGEVVTHAVGAVNGDEGDSGADGDTGEYWTVTGTDGTQYVFGKNRLPGWSSGKAETDSVWTVPVFGDDAGEPGYGSGTSFSGRSKMQAWRWNLDYVVDPHGNVMTYWYDKELNSYAKDGTTGNGTEYTRGGYLKRIDYGQRLARTPDTIFAAPPAARVKFQVKERCVPVSGGETCASLTQSNRNAWPDVPFDLICKKDTKCTDQPSPSFFSQKRLTDVTTQVYKGTGTGADTDYRDVNNWTFEQSFPDPGDGSNASLWLKSIEHTGRVGTAVTMPPVTFGGVQLHNRVDKIGDDVAPFIKWRVRTITSETGSVLTVNYSDHDCAADSTPTALDRNVKRCFPVKWIPPSNPTPGTNPSPRTDWFHKYVVTQVSESDPTGGAPLKQTDYSYHDGGAWAYDDQSPITQAKYRTWGIWRGYQRVTTTVGETVGARSKSTTLYYRGMDGDKQSDNTTREATVTDSKGVEVPDAEQYAGQVREQITYNGVTGAETSGTISTPWSVRTSTDKHTYGTVNGYMVRTKSQVQRTPKAGGGELTSQTTLTHDPDTGRVLTSENEGGAHKECVRSEYTGNGIAWNHGLLKRVEKVSADCSATPARTDDPKTTDVISDVRLSYDGLAWGSVPVRGLVTSKSRVKKYAGEVPQLQAVETTAYDALGRPTETYDAKGTRTKRVEYTPVDGGPVTRTKEINALNHTVVAERIPDWGVSKASTDPNNRRTEMAYDGLGRLTDVWLADRDRATQATPSQKFEYKVQRGSASWVATKSLNNDGSTYLTSYAIYDALLRPRQTQTPAVGGGRVISETRYDTRGLEVETAFDYIDQTAPSGALATLLTASPAGTETIFDGAGRPTAEITLVRGKEFARTKHTYDGNATIVEPPLGASAIREEVDARGRLTEKLEYDGSTATGSHTRLSYFFDHAERLAKVEDSSGNVWSYGYDFLGRENSSTDPDTGRSTTEYNDLDQVVSTTDARGKILSFTTDVLGRPTGKLDGALPVVNGEPVIDESKYLARWTYDSIALGRPTSSIRYDGGKNGKMYAVTNASYDRLYRVLKEQYNISTSLGALAGTGIYTITNAYNLDGSLQSRSIPAMGGLPAELMQFGYNELRMPTTLKGLTGVVQGTAYLPSGEHIQTSLGVSSSARWTEVNNSYEDGTRRLERQTVVSETNSSTDSDVHYKYDPAGNPTEIDDRATTPGDKQCFAYDGHRRLKSAWTAAAACSTSPTVANVGGTAPYWQSFTYDSLGNRATAVDHLSAGGPVTTTYNHDLKNEETDEPRPHLLSSTLRQEPGGSESSTSYTYDDAGNTTSRTLSGDKQTLEWNSEGSLAKVTSVTETATAMTTFLNDAEGARLIREDETGTTLYLGETELRLDKVTAKVEATRYYSHGGQAVALRTPTALTWLTTDLNGTASAQIDAATQVVTRRYMRPFGEDRGRPPVLWAGDKGFVGGTEDPTGLVHLGAREYDPSTGRFISADPVMDLKDPQQINGYAYSNNNPVAFADPDGKFFFGLIRVIVAVVKAVLAANVHGSNRGHSVRNVSYSPSGTSSYGGGGGGGGDGGGAVGGPDCSARPYAGCGSSEPDNPKPLGSMKDLLAGIGKAVVEGLDAIEYATEPQCWGGGGNCGLSDKYDELQEKEGIDKETKLYDAGDKAATVASMFNVMGIVKTLRKRLLKGAAKKTDCGDSFVPGTTVLLADGTEKAIEDIDLGDEILATDPKTGETTAKKVVGVIVTDSDEDFVNLVVDGKNGPGSLIVTVGHKFWAESEGAWLTAGELEAGMSLRGPDGTTVRISAVEPFHKRQRTHDLTVEAIHSYYVHADETPVLAHNCNDYAGDEAKFPDAVHTLKEHVSPDNVTLRKLIKKKGVNSVWDDASVIQGLVNKEIDKLKQGGQKSPLQKWLRGPDQQKTVTGVHGPKGTSLGTSYTLDSSDNLVRTATGNSYVLVLQKMPKHPNGFVVYTMYPR